MARILILEPQPEIRELVGRVARRLGHEAVTEVPAKLETIDAVVLEPDSHRGLAVAQQLRERSPELPIVCASIMPRGPEAASLAPVAYLTKPFALADLERVLTDALPDRP